MTPEQPGKAREAVYNLGDRKLTLNANDARQMREALLVYFAAHTAEVRDFGVDPEPGEALIDSTGSVRIGTWLLDAHNGQLILGTRLGDPSQGRSTYRLLASVGRGPDGKWIVTGIQPERILPRR